MQGTHPDMTASHLTTTYSQLSTLYLSRMLSLLSFEERNSPSRLFYSKRVPCQVFLESWCRNLRINRRLLCKTREGLLDRTLPQFWHQFAYLSIERDEGSSSLLSCMRSHPSWSYQSQGSWKPQASRLPQAAFFLVRMVTGIIVPVAVAEFRCLKGLSFVEFPKMGRSESWNVTHLRASGA